MSGPELRSRRIRRALALASAAGIALGLGCRERGEDTLVLGAMRLPTNALVFLAEESGCFAREGLRVDRREFATGRDALAALLRGEVEVATAFHTPVVFQAFARPDLRIVTLLHSATRNTHMAARADRGVREAGDLRGRRIGLPRRTNAEFFVRTVLEFEGIPLSDVTLVEIAPEAAAAALASGEVDAVAVWAPHVDDAVAALPAGSAAEIYSDVYMEGSVLVTREAVRSSRARGLTKLVRCLREAQEEIDASKDGGLGIARRLFRDEAPGRIERHFADVTVQLGLTNALVAILEQEGEWLRSAGEVQGPLPSFEALFAPEFLQATHPDAITHVSGR